MKLPIRNMKHHSSAFPSGIIFLLYGMQDFNVGICGQRMDIFSAELVPPCGVDFQRNSNASRGFSLDKNWLITHFSLDFIDPRHQCSTVLHAIHIARRRRSERLTFRINPPGFIHQWKMAQRGNRGLEKWKVGGCHDAALVVEEEAAFREGCHQHVGGDGFVAKEKHFLRGFFTSASDLGEAQSL